MSKTLSFGLVGLGRMGAALAASALDHGIHVVSYDPHRPTEELVAAGLRAVDSLSHLGNELEHPRIVLLYVPAGAVVDRLLDELLGVLEPGDIVADGGNSYWRDSQRRGDWLAKHEIGFVDLGTSGGISGARHGACFMAGGEAAHVAKIEPLLRELAVEGGYVHAGPSGAGHLAKLVHNGIEFGMLQAIGEGIALLEAYNRADDTRVSLDTVEILRVWRHGSVIRSWLIDLLHEGYRDRGGLDPGQTVARSHHGGFGATASRIRLGGECRLPDPGASPGAARSGRDPIS